MRDFACDFLIEVDNLDYNETDIKEVFNICLNQPLSQWEMKKLGNLGYWDFVYHIYHRGEPKHPPQAKSHSTDCPLLPPAVSGSTSPPMTHKRRRKNGPAVAPREVADNSAAAPPVAANDVAAVPPVVADVAAMPPGAAEEAAASPQAANETAAPPEVAEDAALPPEAVMSLPRSH